jgi:hypothetical protein
MGAAGADEMSEFDKYLTAIGKSRDTATDLDEIQWLRSERQRMRLTDEERTAIGLARSVFEDYKMSRLHSAADEVLERLLERTK